MIEIAIQYIQAVSYFAIAIGFLFLATSDQHKKTRVAVWLHSILFAFFLVMGVTKVTGIFDAYASSTIVNYALTPLSVILCGFQWAVIFRQTKNDAIQ